jgi:hypothetical protein
MGPKAQKVLKEALELPVEDRAKVAALLLNSVDRPAKVAAEGAWAKVKARTPEVDPAAVKPIHWEEARKRMDDAINSRKRP